MNIRDQQDELFIQWKNARQNRTGFVRDGVGCEREYLKSSPKIAIILKEANNPDGGDSNLIDQLADGVGYKIWCNVARWIYGVRNRKAMPKWADFQSEIENSECRKKLFESICVINLKKSPGGSTSGKSLGIVAKEDEEFIQKQYSMYDPDLTLCGGTGYLFKTVLKHEDKKWKQTSRGAWWYERAEGKYVLYLYHPAVMGVVRNPLLFYEMLDTLNEIYT